MSRSRERCAVALMTLYAVSASLVFGAMPFASTSPPLCRDTSWWNGADWSGYIGLLLLVILWAPCAFIYIISEIPDCSVGAARTKEE